LGSRRVADITGGESLGVGHGGGVSGFCELGLTDPLEDFLVLGVAFTGDGEGGESFAEEVSVATGLEGAEHLVNDLGGQGGEVSREYGDRRVNSTLLAVAAKNCIVLSFGGLGKDLVHVRKVVIIGGASHLVHVGRQVLSIAVSEGLLCSVTFELQALLGVVVEDSFEALDTGTESSVGELGSPDSHAGEDAFDGSCGAGLQGLICGRESRRGTRDCELTLGPGVDVHTSNAPPLLHGFPLGTDTSCGGSVGLQEEVVEVLDGVDARALTGEEVRGFITREDHDLSGADVIRVLGSGCLVVKSEHSSPCCAMPIYTGHVSSVIGGDVSGGASEGVSGE
jgi:hypothetical protein